MSGFDDDDLTKDITAALEPKAPDAETPPAAGAAPLSAEPSTDKTAKAPEGERARAADGKFVAATSGAASAPVTPIQTIEPAKDATIAAPSNWMGAGKIEWATLTPAVQKHIADDYARISRADQELQQWGQVIEPERAQAFAAQYGSTQAAIRQLLNISDYATRDKPGFIRWFADQNRIDLSQLVQGAPQDQQAQAGDPNPLVQEVVQLRNQVHQLIQRQTQGTQNQVQSEIDAFARDPANPYFNDVREHMGALMSAGKAGTLREAYDMATWAVPSVRKSLLDAQSQQAMQASAQKVQAAKQAAGSITGSPAGALVASTEPKRNLDEDIAHAVSKALGG